ncbi:XdhC/CoxI family protein (plasmid) [Entomospira entomophila]|uniref:Xanthine dehydrogenase n=1 Tax=Entomospira entomophila TaxID=2719988 RepID=A0A968KS12_9SPIO|nr:XdhC/CoxI family protein [Entomospira entomophilus]NIZ41323.1 xanthine dehydrogenase [Entomospira entomophilus]WDI36265.1 XdhC/CoxI family protein [Entomospira entomophilus]
MTREILLFAEHHITQGHPVALVSITKTNGSSPASLGQLMAVLQDGSIKGTIGGGTTEYQVIQMAISAIQNREKIFEFNFNHAESGMVCGGGMSGFGHILGNENHLYIFGGGHVSQSLAKVASLTGFHVTIIEDRPELKDSFTNVQYIVSTAKDYHNHITISPFAYTVICTRGHQTDEDALKFCISQHPQYIGMIGSKSKVRTLFERVRSAGYTQDQLDSIYTPIGLNIASALPTEIAIAIMAEILIIKNKGTLEHKRNQQS